jgi:hypothetical protein
MPNTVLEGGRRKSALQAERRGSALFLVLVFMGAIGALAVSAIHLTGNASLISSSYDKEADLRYVAEAGMAVGKARLNYDPAALPDTGYTVLLQNHQVTAADNKPIQGITVRVYAGPTGSTSGQFGRFASVIADARDSRGTGFVRRLELAQESFAKFAYWTNSETNNGNPIYFGGNDNLWGPVWSNDQISILSSGAQFHDEVGTAKTISGVANGTYFKGYKTLQKPIALPSNASLTKLSGYAAVAGFSFTPPTGGNETTVRTRIEFVALDMNNDGDSLDVDEGFFRVYNANAGEVDWLRGNWPGSGAAVANVRNCGDWHPIGPSGTPKFFPAAIHNTTWFEAMMDSSAAAGGAGMTPAAALAERNATLATIMQHTNARCYLGGAPQLAAVERTATAYPNPADRQIGGEDTTFTASDPRGAWQQFTTTPNATLAAKRADANYLFPIYRGLNPNSKGVIYADGTVGVSGVLRGRITIYTTGTFVLLDDLRYANDPGAGVCQDILGIITDDNMVVADNGMNTPSIVSGSSTYRHLDETKDLYLHAVIMTLGTSFTVENFNAGPSDFNDCQGTNNGRGCLFLTGGLIQESRGPVGTAGGYGYSKRYSYDRCAVIYPPPYFPTTGRFLDNRFFELDPVGFNVTNLFKSLTPLP